MTPAELRALARRVCEEQPSRELDCEVAATLYGGNIVWRTGLTGEAWPYRRYVSSTHIGGYGKAPVENYTTSLDAAAALMPEGWVAWEIKCQWACEMLFCVCSLVRRDGWKQQVASATTEPQARVAAALLARAADMEARDVKDA